ncbi:hypothetical protein CRENBAI_024124 [Crenichthys baileyi]|uniref:Uncharacterized protein n=1 Tax=Crenichthys baileyi TaxID=28760 RepID=A0AAV9R0L4_9TELE
MNGVIKVQALLDFLSEVYRSKLCSRAFPAKTLSLRRRVEQFPGLKEGQRGRITVVTAVTCSLAGRQNELPHPTATEVRLPPSDPILEVAWPWYGRSWEPMVKKGWRRVEAQQKSGVFHAEGLKSDALGDDWSRRRADLPLIGAAIEE